MEKLTKSKERISKHGEVFTPSWLVSDMLDMLQRENDDESVYSPGKKFLEPSCGNGQFLVQIVERKMKFVNENCWGANYRKYALGALTDCYGVELMEDNCWECRSRMLATWRENYEGILDAITEIKAREIIVANVINANILVDVPDPKKKGKTTKDFDWGLFLYAWTWNGDDWEPKLTTLGACRPQENQN